MRKRTVMAKINEKLYQALKVKREGSRNSGPNMSDLIRFTLEAWVEENPEAKEKLISWLIFQLKR